MPEMVNSHYGTASLRFHLTSPTSRSAVTTVRSDLSLTVLAEACAGDLPKAGDDIVVTTHGDVG